MRGWHNEGYRHSLASRGISTRAKALVNPIGETIHNDIKGIYRVERTIIDLGKMLKRGHIGRDITGHGIYGGLTTSLESESYLHTIGNIYVELDEKSILTNNDLIEVEYTPEFFLKNPDIAEKIDFRISYPIKSKKLARYLADEYADESELVSRKPILIHPENVKKIEIHYGRRVKNPITGDHSEGVIGETESYRIGRDVIGEVKREVPSLYWDRIWLVNTTTGERERLRGD